MASTVDALGNLTGVIVLSSSEIPTGLDRFANGRTVTIVKLSGAKLASLHVCPFERVADLKQALREKVGVPGFFDLLHGTVKLEPRQSLEENQVPDGATLSLVRSVPCNLVTLTGKGLAWSWNGNTGASTQLPLGPNPEGLSSSPDGAFLAVSYVEGSILEIWDCHRGCVKHTLDFVFQFCPDVVQPVTCWAFDCKSQFLVTGHHDDYDRYALLRIASLQTGKCTSSLKVRKEDDDTYDNSDWIYYVSYSHVQRVVAFVPEVGPAKLWQRTGASDRDHVSELNGDETACDVQFCPDC